MLRVLNSFAYFLLLFSQLEKFEIKLSAKQEEHQYLKGQGASCILHPVQTIYQYPVYHPPYTFWKEQYGIWKKEESERKLIRTFLKELKVKPQHCYN